MRKGRGLAFPEAGRNDFRQKTQAQPAHRMDAGKPLLDACRTRWDADIEAYVVKRIRQEPKVKLKQLARELRDNLGYAISERSLAAALSYHIYPRHPEIRSLRSPRLAWGSSLKALSEIRRIAEQAMKDGRYERKFVPLLNLQRRMLIDKLVSGEKIGYLKDIGPQVGISPCNVHVFVSRLLKRLRAIQKGSLLRAPNREREPPKPKRFLRYGNRNAIPGKSELEQANLIKAVLAELRKRRSEP